MKDVGPLKGIRVAGIGVAYAGPYILQLLAHMGAECIRVENPNFVPPATRMVGPFLPSEAYLQNTSPYGAGLPNREAGERPWNRFPIGNATLLDVLSMTVDHTKPEGMDIFLRLISKCDVFVENNPPDTMPKTGITYEKLKEVKPDIIMLRCPSQGLTGPWSTFRGFGNHVEDYVGHSMMRGYSDMDPTSLSIVVVCDHTVGSHGAFAVLSAIASRDQTGKGQLIELSQAETFLPWIGPAVMDCEVNGHIWKPMGNRYPGAAPCGAYRCKGSSIAYGRLDWQPDVGRYVVITCHNDEEWQGLCRGMGNPPWTNEERFADATRREKNQDELDMLIEEWTRERDPFEVMYTLQAEGVPAGPVEDYRDAYNDQHLRARGFFEWCTQEDCGTHLYPGMPWKMTKTPLNLNPRGPARLGEDNEYLYTKVIGVSKKEYARLQKLGHVATKYSMFD